MTVFSDTSPLIYLNLVGAIGSMPRGRRLDQHFAVFRFLPTEPRCCAL